HPAEGRSYILPIGCLLRKNANMLKFCECQSEFDVNRSDLVGNLPFGRVVFRFFNPFSLRMRTSDKACIVPLMPFFTGERFGPVGIRLRTDQRHGTKAFQFFAITTVDKLIVGPLARYTQ